LFTIARDDEDDEKWNGNCMRKKSDKRTNSHTCTGDSLFIFSFSLALAAREQEKNMRNENFPENLAQFFSFSLAEKENERRRQKWLM
jgi:hypothetical protein